MDERAHDINDLFFFFEVDDPSHISMFKAPFLMLGFPDVNDDEEEEDRNKIED